MTTKTCPECTNDLPLADYTKNKSRKDGLAAYCRACTSVKRKKQPSRIKSDEEIVSISFVCRKPGCNRPTRDVTIHRDDIAKMANKFYCHDCNAQFDSEAQLYDGYYYGDNFKQEEIIASELPLMDSTGG